MKSASIVRSAAGAAALFILAAAPCNAHAQVLQRFRLHADLGADTMLTDPQVRNFGWGFHGTVRLGFQIIGPLSVQASAGNWWFTTQGPLMNAPMGRITFFAGGLRLAPRLSEGFLGGPVLDANAGVALTGDLTRFMFDAGVGWEFTPHPAFGFGPMVRYGHVMQPADDPVPGDAGFLQIGLGLTLRVPESRPAPEPAQQPAPPPPPPPADTDGDGLRDPDDRCPREAEDRDQFQDEDGCPDPDNDNDTVLDAQDRCPNEAETRNAYQDEDGCPDTAPPAAEVRNDQIEINQRVLFEYNRADIRAESNPILMEVVRALQSHPEIRRVRVEGHADDRGTPEGNQELSQRRARAVVRWLRQHGARRVRFEAVGHGSTRHVCSEDTEDCHARNRRVEFIIVR